MFINPNYEKKHILWACVPYGLTQPCTGDVCRIGQAGRRNTDKRVFLAPRKAARVVLGFETFCGFDFCVLIFAEDFCDTWKVWRLLQQGQEWEVDPPETNSLSFISAMLSLQSEEKCHEIPEELVAASFENNRNLVTAPFERVQFWLTAKYIVNLCKKKIQNLKSEHFHSISLRPWEVVAEPYVQISWLRFREISLDQKTRN